MWHAQSALQILRKITQNACRSIPAADKAAAPLLLEFARSGGRVVILSQDAWGWKALADFDLQDIDCSRALAYPDAQHAMLAGIDGEYLKRWNGLPGRIAGKTIKGPILDQASKLLWAEEAVMPVVIRVPSGKGEIVPAPRRPIRARLPGAGGTQPSQTPLLPALLVRARMRCSSRV